MFIHTSDTSTQEAEAEGSRIQGKPGLYNKTVSEKKKKSIALMGWTCYNQVGLSFMSYILIPQLLTMQVIIVIWF